MSQGVGVDNATSLADVAKTLSDILKGETSNVTQNTWHAAFQVVDLLSDIRKRHPTTPIHADELQVSTAVPWHSYYSSCLVLASSCRAGGGPVASVGLVSPGAATDGCHPIFSLKNLTTFFKSSPLKVMTIF